MNRHQFASGFVAKQDTEPDQKPEEIPQGHTFYKLVGRKVFPGDMTEAANVGKNNTVERTNIGKVEVSTIFLAVNHGWGEHPILFETMIFGGPRNDETYRCSTYGQAEEQHRMAVDLVRSDPRWNEKE